jgi:serine/threonine protein phosphatase PrpC
MKFSVFQVSRRGGRDKNEDRMGYSYTRGSGIFLLADGMGGHPEGEVAAQLALQTISSAYQKEAKPGIADIPGFLSAAAMAAHRQILRYAIDRGMADTPRTTLVVALVQDGAATWIYCGDSRLYLVREGELLARTRDHSYAEQHKGDVMSEHSPGYKNRNILYTCLGSPTKPQFDITGPIALQQGDKIMLCSDGLWSSVTDVEIAYQLSTKPVAKAVPDLVEKALHKAGDSSDNVTVIALEWETPDALETTRNSISTDSILDGVFDSTVQADSFDSQLDDLDDEAIERSIAEINDAIRRSAAKRV